MNGKFDGCKGAHNLSAAHTTWTSTQQDKNDVLLGMIDDIATNDTAPHQAYTLHCVENPEKATAIANYEDVRKTLYKARKKTGCIRLPQDGAEANSLLSESRFGRNYYGQKLQRATLSQEELNEYDDIKFVNDRIQAINLEKKRLNQEMHKLKHIKHTKFDQFDRQDSLLFLGGDDRGLYQVFCEREAAQILNQADGLLWDGSWGSTPLFSTKCKKRNHYRMELTINACFKNKNDDYAPLLIRCASILFSKDKPSKCLYVDSLRLLQRRCREEYDCQLFNYPQRKEIICMADFETPLRQAILEIIPIALLLGCWFHFCKRLVKKLGDLNLMKLYKDPDDHTFYVFVRCFLMLPLLPKDLIISAFDVLVKLAELNVPYGYKKKFKLFVKYMERTWMDGLYKIDEWCVYGSWIRTNNCTESMNFVSSQTFGKHPLYHDWIQSLALQSAAHINKYHQYQIWKKTKKRPPKEIAKNTLLKNEWIRVAKDHTTESIIYFLRQCSKAMKVSQETLVRMNERYS